MSGNGTQAGILVERVTLRNVRVEGDIGLFEDANSVWADEMVIERFAMPVTHVADQITAVIEGIERLRRARREHNTEDEPVADPVAANPPEPRTS